MKLKHFLTLASLVIGGSNAWAQTDVTSTYLTNADFSQTTALTSTYLYGYDKDGSPANFQTVDGWTSVVTATNTSGSSVGGYAGGVFSYGSSTHLKGNDKGAPTSGPNGGSGNCLGFFAVWSAGGYFYQKVTLPPGAYTINIPVYNQSGTNSTTTYFGWTPDEGTASTIATPTSTGSWTTLTTSFTLTEETKGEIRVGYKSNGSGSGANPHLFIDKVQILCSPFATSSDYEALNTAISAVAGKTWGFDAGEYAPYNYVEVIQALAAAQAIDQDANNSQATVQALTATLNTTMTANAAEVNAIWDASFEHDYSGQSGNINPIGWQRVKDAAADGYNVRLMNGSNAGLAATSSGKAIFTKQSAYYGYAEGYTMPLNANTYYTISFIYGGWGDCKSDGYISMSDPEGNAVTLSSTDLPLVEIAADTKTTAWYEYSSFFKTSAAGNYVIGLRKKNYDTSGQSQYVYGDFVLKTTTVAEATAYYNSVKDEVDDSYDTSANGGAEKTAFKNALDASVPSTLAEIMEAAANLYTLRDAFVTAVPTFDALAAEVVKAENLGVDAAIIAANTANSSTTAAEAKAFTQNLKVAEYNYVTTNFGHGVELGTWTEEGPTGSLTEQHWSSEARPYLEQSSDAYNQSGWEIKYSQNLTLPAGSYVFKVAGRQADSDGVTLSLEVKNGETVLGTVSDFPRSDVGLGINTSGATDYDPNSTYANSNAGRGWEWRYVKFTLDDLATVNVAVSAKATAAHMWVSFCDATIQATSADVAALLAALAEYDAALDAANAAMTNTAYANVQGLEKTNLQDAIDADGSLDKSSLEAVQTATNALTVNTGSFVDAMDSYNAFYQAMAEQTLTKITENVGEDLFQYNATTNDALYSAYLTAKSIVDKFDVTTGTASAVLSYANGLYGAINDYNNQPLNAPTPGQAYIIKNATANLALNIATGSVTIGADAAVYFTAVEGGYVLSNAYGLYIKTGNNNWTLSTTETQAEAYVLTFTHVDGGYTISGEKGLFGTDATAAGSTVYADKAQGNNGVWTIAETEVTEVNMNVAAGKWGTFIAPFDVTIPENVSAYTATGVSNNNVTLEAVETTIPANTPVLLKNDGEDAVAAPLYGISSATKDSYTVGLLTGVYTAATISAGANNYVLQTPKSGDNAGVQAFYKVTSDFTATAYKCYLTYKAGGDVKMLGFDFGGEDAINSIAADDMQNATIYNLAGQRVNKAQKGLYIVNGKKVVK